jgi:UDP-N-acetylglucosamine--N-acetylmuramyl-(pentapeptide) pyrophosphoryl-undecaprenol N-acetylglucosamine transferase
MTRVLFVTSNGTGLGHLTRSMAVARRLGPGVESLVLTLSAAAPVVEEQGFGVEYVASHSTPGTGSSWRWSRRLRGRLRAVFAETEPDVLVFDGVHPYEALLGALGAAPGMHRVWCRRALWLPGSNLGALERERFFDAVLEPGELAADLDRGPTVARRDGAFQVAPMVFCEPADLLERDAAERELGLEPGKRNILVALGQGAEVREATVRSLRALAGRPGVQVAALSSAIAELGELEEGVVHLEATYPMSRYYRAFDVAIAACGYNAFHELVRFGVPTLWVPMRRETDDQAARAHWAGRVGIGHGLDGPASPGLEAALDSLLDDAQRARMTAALEALDIADGAAQAAQWLVELARKPREPKPRRSLLRRYLADPVGSAKAAAPVLRRAPRNIGAIAWQTVTRRPPRTLVLALDLEAGRLERELPKTLATTPDPPARVLVVTNSLELAPLRRAGVAFEHVPARGSAHATAAGGGYDSFLRRRLELILAERPRPRHIVSIGEASEALRASL